MLGCLSHCEDEPAIEVCDYFIDTLVDAGDIMDDKLMIDYVSILHYENIKKIFPRRDTTVKNILEPFIGTLL